MAKKQKPKGKPKRKPVQVKSRAQFRKVQTMFRNGEITYDQFQEARDSIADLDKLPEHVAEKKPRPKKDEAGGEAEG